MTLRCVGRPTVDEYLHIHKYCACAKIVDNMAHDDMGMVATACFVAVHRHLQRRNVRRMWMLPIICRRRSYGEYYQLNGDR